MKTARALDAWLKCIKILPQIKHLVAVHYLSWGIIGKYYDYFVLRGRSGCENPVMAHNSFLMRTPCIPTPGLLPYKLPWIRCDNNVGKWSLWYSFRPMQTCLFTVFQSLNFDFVLMKMSLFHHNFVMTNFISHIATDRASVRVVSFVVNATFPGVSIKNRIKSFQKVLLSHNTW